MKCEIINSTLSTVTVVGTTTKSPANLAGSRPTATISSSPHPQILS